MRDQEIASLAEASVQLYSVKEGSADHERLFWAFEKLYGVVEDDPISAIAVIEAIMAITDDKRVIANLAAGPVEDVLVKHDPAIIDDLCDRARKYPHWRRMFGGVWQSSMDQMVWLKMQAVSDPSW